LKWAKIFVAMGGRLMEARYRILGGKWLDEVQRHGANETYADDGAAGFDCCDEAQQSIQ